MRPSAINFSKAFFAISRRTGSNPLNTTASGVSSIIKSIPVTVSMARMFRPSRPIIRPFMSSLGNVTTDTVVSATMSAAERWMALTTKFLARFSASAAACSSLSLIITARSETKASFVSDKICSRASSRLKFAISTNFASRSVINSSARFCLSLTLCRW